MECQKLFSYLRLMFPSVKFSQSCYGKMNCDMSLSTMFCLGTAHLFSRSGMLRFLAAKHILRGMTFLSLVLFWCFGEPESSLPLKLGDWGAAPSHGRSDTKDGFLIYGVTSRMNLTMNKNQRRRLAFLLPIKNDN